MNEKIKYYDIPNNENAITKVYVRPIDVPSGGTGFEDNVINGFIDKLDNSNAVTLMGTLEFVDRMAKFFNTDLTCQIKDSEFDELSRQSSGYKHYAETIKRTSVYERDDAFLDTRRRAVQLRENATRARGIDTRMLGNDRREIQRLESERVSTRGKGSTLSAIERAKLRRVKKTSRTLARPTRRESKSGTATGTSGATRRDRGNRSSRKSRNPGRPSGGGTWRRTLGGGLNIEKTKERTKKKNNKLLEGGRRKRTSHKGDLSKIN
jgi:hypothetical protein